MMRSIYIVYCYVFFFKYTASTEIYTYCPTLSLHDALPICLRILAERFPLALRLAGAAHIDRDGDVAVCGDVRIGTADRADDAAGSTVVAGLHEYDRQRGVDRVAVGVGRHRHVGGKLHAIAHRDVDWKSTRLNSSH